MSESSPFPRQNSLLRQAREERGLSQSDVAEEIGVDVRTYRRWENEGQMPGGYAQRRLLTLFGKTTPEALGFGERTRRRASQKEIPSLPSAPPDTSSSAPSSNESSQMPSSRSTNRATLMNRNHHRFLNKLQNRYTDVLDHCLQGIIPIALALHNKPNAVINTTRVQFRQTHPPEPPLSADTCLLDIYDQASGELLLLGDPGAGKTTLLLHLAQTLCQRAKQDEHMPLPVIVNLSTWANTRKSLEEWLIQEIVRNYQVPRSFIARCVQEDEVLPLLDGLDEVSQEQQSACIEAINSFTQHHLVPLVVCSRRQEYLTGQRRLLLHTAVVIQPLEEEQVNEYFQAAGPSLSGIRSVLCEDTVLRELVRTPLLLHVIALTYQGVSVHDLPKKGTREEQQRLILERYVQRRMQDQQALGETQRTLHWLSCLAQQMRNHNQTVFYVEHLQPDWLPPGRLRQVYDTLAGKFSGILVGVLMSLLINITLFTSVTALSSLIREGLLGGLIGGLISDNCFTDFSPTAVGKAWRRRWRQLSLLSIRNGALLGIAAAVASIFDHSFREGLLYGISTGWCGFLLSGVIEAGKVASLPGVSAREQEIREKRWWNERFRPGSLSLSVFVGLSVGLSYALSNGLGRGIVSCLSFGIITLAFCILFPEKNTIELTEIITWSVKDSKRVFLRRHHLHRALVIIFLVCLFEGIGSVLLLHVELSVAMSYGLGIGLLASLLYGLFLLLWGGLSREVIDDHHRVEPNQGIRQSIRNVIVIGLISGCLYGTASIPMNLFFNTILYGGLSGKLISSGLRDGLVLGIIGALLIALLMGGLMGLRHFLLRGLLTYAGLLPWRTIRFLDDAARRILLYRDGGGYRFIHRLFLDYFADHEVSPGPFTNEF